MIPPPCRGFRGVSKHWKLKEDNKRSKKKKKNFVSYNHVCMYVCDGELTSMLAV